MARGSVTWVLAVISFLLIGGSILLITPIWDTIYYYAQCVGVHENALATFYSFWYLLPLGSVILTIISAIIDGQNPL